MSSHDAYRPDMPTQELAELVSAALGRRCMLEKISGYLNRTEVFRINANDAVVKVYHHAPRSKFSRERSAYQLLCGIELPLARILAQGVLPDATPWMALSFLPGKSPEDCADSFTSQDSTQLFRQLGNIARGLHRVTDDPIKDIDEILRPAMNDVPESRRRYAEYRDLALEIHGPFRRMMIDAAKTMDKLAERMREPVEPRFVHGDFSSRNVLIDWHDRRLSVSGIVDFERCRFGDPAQDLANLWFKDLCADVCRQTAFVDGYGSFETGIDDRVHWHLLGLMFEIASWAPERDPDYFQRAMRMLDKLATGRRRFFESP